MNNQFKQSSANIKPQEKKIKIFAPNFAFKKETSNSKKNIEAERIKRNNEERKQIENFKTKVEEELNNKKKEAKKQSEKIVALAENNAFQKIKAGNNEYKSIIEAANVKSNEIIELANNESSEIVEKAKKNTKEIKETAYNDGFNKGLEDSFVKGKEEINQLLERLEKIIKETINKRVEIIEKSEKQLINICMIMTKKIIKDITNSDKSIILRNISNALNRLKSPTSVTIRVNTNDLKISKTHKDNFYKMLENIESINIIEDITIEKGGCIIETDFGDIDLRISSQLDEIEKTINKIQPMKDI